jgi:hypothetical protein
MTIRAFVAALALLLGLVPAARAVTCDTGPYSHDILRFNSGSLIAFYPGTDARVIF